MLKIKVRSRILENKIKKKQDEIIIGRNSVKEAIISGHTIDSILIAKGERNGAINIIIRKAKELKIPVKETDSKRLDFLCDGGHHQGVIAIVAAHEYAGIDDIFDTANKKGELPFIIVADEIEDPHNLGAIIRTAECAGAHGVIIPNRRAVGLTFTVSKSAAGALEHIKVARVANIAKTIDQLKKQGLWIYGADMEGQTYCKSDLKGAIALVIGNEGFGMSRLVKEKCDVILSIPLCGKINSLNASVAAGILMYEVTRQRLGIPAK